MQSVTAFELLVPQMGNEVRVDASRLFASNDEDIAPGSKSGLDALLAAWTAIFQQQVLPEAQNVPTGEAGFDLSTGAAGVDVETHGTKQELHSRPDTNVAIDILGSLAGRAAIQWQQEKEPSEIASAPVDVQTEKKVELQMPSPLPSSDCKGIVSIEAIFAPLAGGSQSQLLTDPQDVGGSREELHFSSEGKKSPQTKLPAASLAVEESADEVLTEDAPIVVNTVDVSKLEHGLPVGVLPAAVLPVAAVASFKLKPESVVGTIAKQSSPAEIVGKNFQAASPRGPVSVDGIKEKRIQGMDVVPETADFDPANVEPPSFDTEIRLKSEGLSRFKAAIDKAALPMRQVESQAAVKSALELETMQDLTGSPEIEESSRPVETNEAPQQALSQELPKERARSEAQPIEHQKEQAVVAQALFDSPKRQSSAPVQATSAPTKSAPTPKSEAQVPFALASGEAKTISIRIPLTDASQAGTGAARHIDLVFNNRSSNLTLQFHSPSEEIQQRIEESMSTLLDKLQTADWTSKPVEAGAQSGAPEAASEVRKRVESFLPSGANPELARDLSMAGPSSQQGSNLDDASANRREPHSQNPAGRNRKKVQAWQAEFDEQLEP